MEKTDLTGASLEGADLREANLTELRGKRASFAGANLENADLSQANLIGADLPRARLTGATLRRAQLRDANLADANLTGANGLLAGQFGGVILSGTKLPDGFSLTEGLANVAEASKSTQNLFASILFVCAYTWLTVASTTDAQLLNNAAPPSSKLPMLGMDIPLPRFYAVAPLLLLCMYMYFHLGLQRLWEELSELPAVFPDGRPLDKKAYPWLMNVLVRAHTARLRENRSHLSRWQSRISVLLAWGLVPGTLLLVWGRYLRGQDWFFTSVHVAVLAIVIGAGSGFRRLASSTLQGAEKRSFLWKRAWKDFRAHSVMMALLMVVVFGLLSFGAIDGINPKMADYKIPMPEMKGMALANPRVWVPRLFSLVGFPPFAQLDDAMLSTKPASWTEIRREAGSTAEKTAPTKESDLAAVKGADMSGRSLRYASAYNAFFINAYMQRADVQRSDLRAADFRRADLRDANLFGVNLRDADLSEADLKRADLREARLYAANLTKAKLNDAKLQNTSLERAILEQAVLTGTDLANAVLERANLQSADFSADEPNTIANLHGANLDSAVLRGADLTGADLTNASLNQARLDRNPNPPSKYENAVDSLFAKSSHDPAEEGRTRLRGAKLGGAKLEGADLSDTDLGGADLSGANLRSSILLGANLDQANLSGADLTGATGLTARQIASTRHDAATRWPATLDEHSRLGTTETTTARGPSAP
jgi:uncharacterized protein YjbI with pentapeptide repeats